MSSHMKPNMNTLERIINSLPSYVPKEVVLLGSFALVARIYLEKNLRVEPDRNTKDIDLMFLKPEDEDTFLYEGNYTMPFPGHYVLSLDDTVVELFSESSFTDLIGENYSSIYDFLFERDENGNYTHMDKLTIGDRAIYVPKISAIILMKGRSYGKRLSNVDKDRNDLAFLRGYLPSQYNYALAYLKEREEDYPAIKDILEKIKEMFNTR